MTGPSFFLVAGESSGDQRGAELMRALRARAPGASFRGLGGPRMKELADGPFDDWIAGAAVIGVADVLRKYGWFKRRFDGALAAVAAARPDAVVLIDYPGFNLRFAKALRARGTASRTVYFISPQVWAWNRGRIAEMARTIDLMLCIFPFEQPLYERSGLRAEFVGHPAVDTLGVLPPIERDPDLVALLPGSRPKEVAKIFPPLVRAARLLAARRPATRFAAAAASPVAEKLLRAIAAAEGAPPIDIALGTAHDLMRAAAAGIVASGTATLEAAMLGLPHSLVYRTGWTTYWLGRRLIRVDHLGIVNILAGREVVREFIQGEARPETLAAATLELLDDAGARARLQARLRETVALLGPPGAADRAAAAILG